MSRVIILSLVLSSIIFANELEILQNDKKELRQIEKKVIQEKYEADKNEWIGTIDLKSSLGKSRDFTDNQSSDMSRSVGLSFSQSIFESGGIEQSIQYAKEQLNSSLIAWENDNVLILQTIYETLLNIKKLNLQIEQSDYYLKNKDIELILKRIQYEAGKADIIDLNNDKLVGTIGLEHFNWIERSAVLGIFIGDEDYRSNGYGTESIKLLLEYGFKYLNLHSIRLDLLAVNERAHKCYLKCGFKDTGKSREEIFLNGKYYDKLHMDILEYEFEGDYIRNKNVK